MLVFKEVLPRQKQLRGNEEGGGRRSRQGIHQDGKNAISELRLAIQCEGGFKPGERKLPAELPSTEAAGTNLENPLRIHALVWHKRKHRLHKKVCDSARYL